MMCIVTTLGVVIASLRAKAHTMDDARTCTQPPTEASLQDVETLLQMSSGKTHFMQHFGFVANESESIGKKPHVGRKPYRYAKGCQGNKPPNGQTVRCGSLDASTIPKFKIPLVIPPVMRSSGENHYDIAVQQFEQQILPGGMWKNEIWKDITGEQGDWDFPATPVFGYGNSGDDKPDSSSLGGGDGVAPAPNSQFNYPGYTLEARKDVQVSVNWINNLVYDPWGEYSYRRCECSSKPVARCSKRCKKLCECSAKWHSTCRKACQFLSHILPVDQSLHWANPGQLECGDGSRRTDCRPAESPELKRPYKGPVPIVTHLHGGHTPANSDGYPEAWYLADACNIPEGFDSTGAFVNQFGTETNQQPGVASFSYPNDQPSTTLWYHDHTLGITRLNVYSGMAGFYLLREQDGSETGLLSGKLPGPAPSEGQGLEETNFPKNRRKFREIPIVIQDKCFNKDGSLFYPDNRAYFQDLTRQQLRIPFIGDDSDPQSDISPIWNPEAFFDVMVVNGAAWPLHDVEPDLYRFRLLNGCGSRFLNLALLVVVDGEPDPTQELPFYQIGADQGLLPKVVKVIRGCSIELQGNGEDPDCQPVVGPEALLLAPAERADVIVDFTGLKCGQRVRMVNTAPDTPFGGFDSTTVPADPSTTGQVMEFLIVKDTPKGEEATHPKWLHLSLPDPDVPPVTNIRDLALLEDSSKTICATTQPDGSIEWDQDALPIPNSGTCVDSQGNVGASTPFGPQSALLGTGGNTASSITPTLWSDGIKQNPSLGSTERWKLWNWSPDSHPIHLHPIKCKLISRQSFSTTTENLIGSPVFAEKREAGWKDTFIAFPNQLTIIECEFDLPGAYVWHCHILEHEDNEMMVPYCIGDIGTAPGCSNVPTAMLRRPTAQRQKQNESAKIETSPVAAEEGGDEQSDTEKVESDDADEEEIDGIDQVDVTPLAAEEGGDEQSEMEKVESDDVGDVETDGTDQVEATPLAAEEGGDEQSETEKVESDDAGQEGGNDHVETAPSEDKDGEDKDETVKVDDEVGDQDGSAQPGATTTGGDIDVVDENEENEE